MSTAFKLEDPGEGIREAEILKVLISEGDSVSEGDPVFEVETDKAAVEISASFSGTIASIDVAEGDVAEVGGTLLHYDSEDSDDAKDSSKKKGGGRSQRKSDKSGDDKDKKTKKDKGEKKKRKQDADRDEKAHKKRKKGEAKDRKKRKGSDDKSDEERDAKRSKPASKRKKKRKQQEDQDDTDTSDTTREPVPAAPATRRLARELGVDLRSVTGTGPHDRVTEDDVRAAAEDADDSDSPDEDSVAGEGEGGELRGQLERFGPVSSEPLRGLRRATAQAMAESWRRIPHVMHHDLADIDELEALRAQHAELVDRERDRPSLTAYLVKALASALREFPSFNVSLDEDSDEIVYKEYVHVGIAVATDRGLLVPVLRDADRASLREIAAELRRLARAAQDGELERDDMRGGSMTITNVGAIGGRSFTPIIKQPESGILGVGASYQELVPGEGTHGAPRTVTRLPLSFAFDHRLNDGAEAARFVNHIRELLADPAAFTLEV